MPTTEVAVIEVAAQRAVLGACDLCAQGETTLRSAVFIQGAAGLVAAFEVCGGCERAVRRLAAAIPGVARFANGDPGFRVIERTPLPTDTLPAAAEVVHEYAATLQDGTGATFAPRVCGAARSDGTWIGWLEFADPTGAVVLRTGRETTQPDRGALAYWASGLQDSYLEGAFRRTHRVGNEPDSS